MGFLSSFLILSSTCPLIRTCRLKCLQDDGFGRFVVVEDVDVVVDDVQ